MRLQRPSRAWGWVGPGLLLFGCFFELEELVVPPGFGGAGDGGISTSGGAAGVGQGGGLNGGSAGSVVIDACPPGQKRCSGEGPCVPMMVANGCGSEQCGQPCLAPLQASVSCNTDTGDCSVDRCNPGFADCNGDVINDVGDVVGDGCEYSFGTIAPFVQPLDVRKAIIQFDGQRDDWSAIPAQTFNELCADCSDPYLPPITEDASPPSGNDLDAYFRVAWDGNFLYVLAEAFDNHLFKGGSAVNGNGCGEHGAACDDAFSVFVDGLNNRAPGSDYGNDDHRVFFGLSGGFAAPGQGAPSPEDVNLVVNQDIGPYCYRIEARLDWQYVTGTRGGANADGQFPPLPGQSYGFDIAVSDWDPSISDDSVIERQSQVFWVNPGDDYAFRSQGFGAMTLSDPSGSGGPQ